MTQAADTENDLLTGSDEREELPEGADNLPGTEGDDDSSAPVEGAGSGDDEGDDEGAELVISLGDDEPPPQANEKEAPTWLRDLRKSNREKDRRIRELEQRLSTAQPAAAPVVVGEKPKLADYEFDEDKFSDALDQWHERKRKADEAVAERSRTQKAAEDAWNTKLTAYETNKKALPVRDFEDAEEAAKDLLSEVQQGIILHAAKSPEKVIYALGKNPKRLAELAAIKDPVSFAVALGGLEKDMKVTKRTAPPPPETRVRSTVSGAAAVDNQLERLRQEARQTGNYDKVTAFQREKREKAKQTA